jgi:hypothetical protein
MRAIKGFILFGFLGSVVSACFDAPEFADTPEISFEKIQFKETPASADYDTLILFLDFKDGDGDLGLDPNSTEDSRYPFNDAFYYLATGSSKIDSVTTTVVYTSSPPYDAFILLESEADFTGPLVTERMRSEPGFEFLPEYDPNSCLNYSTTQVLVPEWFEAVDETYNILDTLFDGLDNEYYLVEEALLYERNVNHYNIDVEFFVLEAGNFVPYDWFENFCIEFNGRFPLLGKGERPLEGTIRYAMANPSFKAIFGVKTLKLRIKIRDRALRTSNVIETPPFTLNSI